jgi:8-amino-7-oxononanoate synthase
MFHTIDQQPSRSIQIEGREYLFFSGTSYLGLSDNQQFKQYFKESIDRYGTSFGVSRNGNLQLEIYERVERQLADFVGAETALTFSSGMLAGQAVVNLLRPQHPSVFYAPLAHPANWFEPDAKVSTDSFGAWVEELLNYVKVVPKPVVVVCNSVDALKLSDVNLDFIDQIAEHDALVVVDDSHGLGVLNEGKGIFPTIKNKPNVLVVSSLHKAFGIPGGVVFGDEVYVKAIKKTVFFSACSPIAPAYLATFEAMKDQYAPLNKKLKQNFKLLLSLLKNPAMFQFQADHCVLYTQSKALYEFLFERGIFIYNFAYPDPNGVPNTRIVVSAWHTEADIRTLAEGVNAFEGK